MKETTDPELHKEGTEVSSGSTVSGMTTLSLDEWWNLFEVQLAERMSDGGAEGFVRTLIHVIDSGIVKLLRAELERRGLTIEDLADMRSRVLNGEGENVDLEYDNAGNKRSFLLSDPARRAVKRLFLASFDTNQIADLLDLEAERVAVYLDSFRPNAREIIFRHREGESAASIAANLRTTRKRVNEMIEAFGEAPIQERNRVTPEQRKRILALRLEGHGYTAIARRVDCDYYQVRFACRQDAIAATKNPNRVDL